ncbi:MAG: pentapeptide repeat-containing protein [Phormidesmis sp.]
MLDLSEGANLRGAKMGFANLTGADLTGADLTGATRSNWERALERTTVCRTVMPDGSIRNS